MPTFRWCRFLVVLAAGCVSPTTSPPATTTFSNTEATDEPADVSVVVNTTGPAEPKSTPTTSQAAASDNHLQAPTSTPAQTQLMPSPTPEAKPSPPVKVAEGLDVDCDRREVLIAGVACLDAGWLEQVVCRRGTREHESLVVTDVSPRMIHAALLLLGARPGAPGRWTFDRQLELIPPTGTPVDVLVRYQRGGSQVEHPIADWICNEQGKTGFPATAWVFGGSALVKNGSEEIYVADISGSVVGLVTFGDELLGRPEVLADQVAIQPPEWQVCTDRVPPVGTRVTVVLRPR